MLFGSSGIRRTFDLDFVGLSVRVGAAVAGRARRVVLGRDTRTTSPILADAVTAGLLSGGAEVQFMGIVPTPAVAYAARGADAGCMITASHNPEPDNGIKLFSPSGASFTQAIQDEVEAAITAGPPLSGWRDQGRVVKADGISPYKQAILDAVSIAEEIAVVVDCGNGAGSVVTPYLLAEAGVVPSCINCNVAGRFARPSEPLAESVPYLPEQVRKLSAACAVIHDGDADRMMAFDGRGRYVTGDQMLMLFADYLGSKRVVTTFDASMAIEEIADVKRTPVGDVYVSEQLLSWGDFGGEPSGAWVFPSHSFCPDGPYAAALFCEIASSCNVAEEIDRMHTYPVLRESIRFGTREEANRLVMALGAEKATDGLRIEAEDGWYLIRASGTEPKVRVTAEGRTMDAAKRLMEKGKNSLKSGKLV